MKLHEIRQLKKDRHANITEVLNSNDFSQLKVEQRYFVSLPTNDAHNSVHPTGVVGGMAQRVHPTISKKIEDLVKEGITELSEVKRNLRYYVKTEMKTNPPSVNNRSFYPTNADIHNHISAAKTAIQLSKFDQISLKNLYDEWVKSEKTGNYFFRPYIKQDDIESSDNEIPPKENPSISDPNTNFPQTLLWIYQEEWQKNLLIKYGNSMTLIDATYKTTKYDLPLFFVTVRTNVGYKVVAHFIIQSETTEQILEALNLLKTWNPQWNPPFFLSDYSEAEISAIERAFPGITVYVCDFHREQAWSRWVRDHKNGLEKHQQEALLTSLRKCAWAPSADDCTDSNYQQALDLLKQSPEWQGNKRVQVWLTTTWLCTPQVSYVNTDTP